MSTNSTARRRLSLDALGGVIVIGGLLAALLPGTVAAQGERATAASAWQRAGMPFSPAGVAIWDVIAGGPGFIAVGGGFEEGQTVGTAAIWVSEDGRDWQSVPLLGEAGSGIPRSIASTADGFVAVGTGCCPDRAAVWVSTDGISWERLADQPGFEAAAMLAVTAGSDSLLAVGCSANMECGGGLTWSSLDGRAWSTPIGVDFLPGGVAATSAGLTALGTSGAYGGDAALALSQDGLAWTPVSIPQVQGSLTTAVDVPDGILAAGGTSDPDTGHTLPLLFTSPDGQTWARLTAPGLRSAWVEDIVAAPGGWLLVGWLADDEGQRPATLWSDDLASFRRLRFPKEVKDGGLLHAGAASLDGSTLVVVGSTSLNRGDVATAWFRSLSPSAD